MQWLILTENQDKASRFREVLRSAAAGGSHIEATIISSRGLPWTVEVEISPNELGYKIKEKDSYKEILKKIDQCAQDADRILLAFEPTSTGEATAWEFEKRLGFRKCARLKTNDLDSKSITNSIVRCESLDIGGLPKSNVPVAKAHWVQAVIDLTWTSKVNEWLIEKGGQNPRVTRLMGIIIKAIAESQRRERRYITTSHWEMELTLRPCTGSNQAAGQNKKLDQAPTKAMVIVPTLTQIESGVGPKAQEFWKSKLQESREQAIKGWEIPQPEPGKPWRYSDQQDAKIQKQYIKKFPYFVVEAATPYLIPQELQCPPTNNKIHDFGAEHGWGSPEEIDRALNILYTQGLISNPKSNFPSLSGKTIELLRKYGDKKVTSTLSKEIKVFHSEEEGPNQLEAIHPTNWTILPRQVKIEVAKNNTIKLTSEEFKRIELIYNTIYQWCINSQKENVRTKITRNFLTGPLFLTKKQAEEKDGKKFHIKREEPLHAHMTVLLMAESELNSKERDVMECVDINIKEIKTAAPKNLNISKLLSLLSYQQAGKRETILNILTYLKEQKIISTSKDLKLTEYGEKFLEILEYSFGQYLDTNYLKTLNINLSLIERDLQQDREFLNHWWFSLRSFLQSSKEDKKVLEWKK